MPEEEEADPVAEGSYENIMSDIPLNSVAISSNDPLDNIGRSAPTLLRDKEVLFQKREGSKGGVESVDMSSVLGVNDLIDGSRQKMGVGESNKVGCRGNGREQQACSTEFEPINAKEKKIAGIHVGPSTEQVVQQPIYPLTSCVLRQMVLILKLADFCF